MLVMYGTAQLQAAVRSAGRPGASEFAALAMLLTCLSVAEDLAELRTLGFVSIGIVASAGVLSLLLISSDDAVLTAAPVDDSGQALSLPGTDSASGRVTHLRVLDVTVDNKSLATLTA